MAHNGEINTLRGNINWMHARGALFESDLFGDDIKKVYPIIDPNGSDSAMFDNTLELLVLAGRSLPHAMMMLIPEPWSNHQTMADEKRAFYQFHSCLIEPWDGPASIAFTDGRKIGAVLDRNGLRPSRYYVTKDERVIMASEVGVLDVPADQVAQKGRLQPGRMFLIDTEEGRIVADEEIKGKIAAERPYRLWLNEHLVHVEDLPAAPSLPIPDATTLLKRQIAFGYTYEDLRILLTPMARDGVEAVGSMGNDAALAVLSNQPRILYDYFKQLFAQVTNPPIDSIREDLIISAETRLGSEGNLLNPQPSACRRVELEWPILTNEEMAKIRRLDLPGFKVGVLPILFRVTRGEKGLAKSVEELCVMARRMIEEEEVNIILLSDRGVTQDYAPVPALLAVAGLHHYLIREGLRTRISMVLETGEAREVHHFALLIGYGCSAINPYLAFETVDEMIQDGLLPNVDHKTACKNIVKAASKGVIKVMSKMGISSIQSYRGAQVFEAVGLRQDVVDKYFTWTPSRVGGVGLDVIAQEVLARHHQAFPERAGRRQRAPGRRPVPVARRRRGPPLQSGDHPPPAEGGAHRQLRRVQGIREADQRPVQESLHAAQSARVQGRHRDPARPGRAGGEHHEAVQDRRDVVRLHQQGGARESRRRHESHRRQEQHRRRRRRPRALPAARQRRLAQQRHQAGCLRPLRRHERIPRQRPRTPDQDGAGRQARRGRPAPRHQGVSVDRQGPPHHRRRRPHLAAAAPRHLLDRGSRGAHPRPQERQPRRAHQREAGRRGRRGHDRRRRRQGARRRRPHLRPRRRHRRLAAHLDQACRPALGARPRRDAPDARAE
jgi:hypothetical protein